jgi:peroxiredoxin/uncharacterized membrane protein YphA (DoxX/SURF4 family)
VNLFLLIIRSIVAVVFATAGIAKLADLRGSKKAFLDFGIPKSVALPASIVLSVVELLIALSLLAPSISWYAAIGASGLLLLFIVQMVYQRSKGNAPDCHCFGQLHSEPVSFKSIVRNAICLALAVVLILSGPTRQGLSIEQVTVEMMPTILGTAAVIMLGGALLYLRKIVATQDDLRRRIDIIEIVSRDGTEVNHEHVSDPQEGLPIGSPLPAFELKDLSGTSVTNQDLIGDGRGILFFFVSPTCEPCQALIPDFLEWKNKLHDRVRIVFVSSGRADENRQKFEELGDSTILLDTGRRFALAVGGKWTPTALYVDPNGNIGSHVAPGDVATEELVEKIGKADLDRPFTYFASGNHHGRGLKIGVEAPPFKLTGANGSELRKEHLIGKKTLLTFWSPTCPHCTTFLEEFKEWEGSRSNGDPQVIMISDGDEAEHRDLGVRSPIVIDKGHRTSAKLGMLGTPSAVLINEDGVIQTETAVGARNIWALLGRQNETN